MLIRPYWPSAFHRCIRASGLWRHAWWVWHFGLRLGALWNLSHSLTGMGYFIGKLRVYLQITFDRFIIECLTIRIPIIISYYIIRQVEKEGSSPHVQPESSSVGWACSETCIGVVVPEWNELVADSKSLSSSSSMTCRSLIRSQDRVASSAGLVVAEMWWDLMNGDEIIGSMVHSTGPEVS
jgi:hypothetical protein